MSSLRRSLLGSLVGFLVLLPVAAGAADVGEMEASPAVLAAARAVGGAAGQAGEVVFFTSRRQPLRKLADLRQPQREVASPHLGLARAVMGLLKAGGAPLDPAAAEVMTLVGERHLSRIFAGPVRLVIVNAREAAVVQAAGGLPVVFRGAGGDSVGAAAPAVAVEKAAGGERETSFGALLSVRRAGTAPIRKMDQAQPQTLTARAGHQFVVLTIARDFGRGVGTVSFLYGSGIIVEPAFDRLIVEADGKRLAPRAVDAAGLTVQLGYEVPVGVKKLVLIDGDARVPLTAAGS